MLQATNERRLQLMKLFEKENNNTKLIKSWFGIPQNQMFKKIWSNNVNPQQHLDN